MISFPTLLALLASCVVAYDGTFGAGGTPGDYTEDEYAAFFDPDRRNATGIVHLDGYNVSEPFPPNSTISGWGTRIEVARVDFEGDEKPYPGTRITFEAPNDMTLPGNDSGWNSCIAVFPPEWWKKSVRRKKGSDDNSCSFLSDDCQLALEGAANSYFWDAEGCTTLPTFPEECDNHKSEEGTSTFGFGTTNFSATFNGSTVISYRPDLIGSNGVTEDEAYDMAVGGFWTIMINWGRRDPQRFTTGETPQGSVVCLKADQIENDSRGDAMRPLLDTALVFFAGFFSITWLI